VRGFAPATVRRLACFVRAPAPVPKFRLSAVLLGMLVSLAVWLPWVSGGTTSAAFESSDGNWSDREIPQEGYDFRMILASFEEYKQTCDRPIATMYRTTKRNPFNLIAWWDYAINPKWALPYRPVQVDPVPSRSCGKP
jgi:hypothetical protein